jgi:hypothetical protein
MMARPCPFSKKSKNNIQFFKKFQKNFKKFENNFKKILLHNMYFSKKFENYFFRKTSKICEKRQCLMMAMSPTNLSFEKTKFVRCGRKIDR